MPAMSVAIDIGTLITTHPEIHNGSPIIAGTGVTVRRIAVDYKMGLTPEEITQETPHLTLSQVYAALAFYHTNKDMIEADIAAQEADVERLDAVSLVPVESDMTIEEAALFLNVSEIFINKLLLEGAINYVMVGSERRICLADLMAYKKQRTVKRREILRELAQFSQEEELNDKRVYS